MEDKLRPTNQPESDEPEEAITPKQRRFNGDFLSGWLKRRAETAPAPSETEDDEEEEDAPKILPRTQRFFQRLFPSLVSEPPERSRPDAASSLWDTFLRQSVPAEAPEAGPNPDLPEETTAQDPLWPEQTETLPPEPPEPEEIPPPTQEFTATTPARAGERVINPVRNVLPAAAAFLGAELLSRGRDRKIRREMKKTAKDLTKVRRQTEKIEQRLSEARQPEVLAPSLVQEAKKIVSERRAAQKAPETGRILKNSLEKARIEPLEMVTSEQVAPEVLEQPGKTVYKLEELLHPKPEMVRPETIQRRVEKAAEEDEAMERLFELRHEIRDEPKTAQQGGLMPNTMPSSKAVPPVPPPVFSPNLRAAVAAYSRDQSESAPPMPGIYKKAVQDGVWGGLGVLVFILVLYLIR